MTRDEELNWSNGVTRGGSWVVLAWIEADRRVKGPSVELKVELAVYSAVTFEGSSSVITAA